MHKQQGFSLIELLIVVGIIAALSAIAVPAYVNKQKIAEFNAGLASGRALLTRLDLYLDEEDGTVKDFIDQLKADDKKAMLGELATVSALADSSDNDNQAGIKVTFTDNSAIKGTTITFTKEKYVWQCHYHIGSKVAFEKSDIKGCVASQAAGS
ncbi:hypothetical protein BZG20_08475 [Salinivibrio sp. IB868]|uniref:pilin n=1 Tax=unclassified Salinivibrio TaxID=2636825 RepID=UPI00098783EF|nr:MULTISPECIES: prepilin-type N-terminal cleavage/methylation domain-containing protein [unclassified Salinivibrio]OOE66880.1 hypothetical protein BZG20_08475 [Salinivibrio sp. IB868]OOE75752.1 hypothetical protein BZG22_05570 [Salinivibrio sp. IB870]